MPIRFEEGTALLEGVVGVEDAETLVSWLRSQPNPAVALNGCVHLHAAVLQALLVLRPAIVSRPTERWLSEVLSW